MFRLRRERRWVPAGVAAPRLWALAGLGLLAGLLAACSLAGDVTPPPGSGGVTRPAATPAAAQPTAAATGAPESPTAPAEAVLPVSRPVALEGGYDYQARCAACHGVRGAADGPMTAQLPTPPPNFADPATLRERTPQELFAIITEGRLEAFMPPFADTLSEAERWNVVSFLYSLGTSADQIAAGEAVYNAQCASCHGAGGQGDGPAAPVDMPDLSDPAEMARRSQAEMFSLVSGGDADHPFDRLSEDERWATLAYVRALAFDFVPVEAVVAERPGSLAGRVVNATTGAAPPAGLAVNLHTFYGETLLSTLTATVGAGGVVTFSDVAFAPGRQFLLTTEYEGVTYRSEVAAFNGGEPALTVELPIYETTTDAAVLSVAQMHMFLEFSEPGWVRVGQLYIFSNSSNRAYASRGDARLRISLPPGADDVSVQGARENETFFRTADGFNALWQVLPGEGSGQILFSYRLPYNGELDFAQPMDYPVSAVNVLVADPGIRLSGPALQDLGLQDFQGEQFRNYSQAGLAAGDTLQFAVGGEPGSAASAPGLVSSPSSLAVGLGALALALLGVGLWLYRRPAAAAPGRQAQAEPDLAAMTDDELIEAIAGLDDAYAAGELDQGDYVIERAELKDELRRRWEKTSA